MNTNELKIWKEYAAGLEQQDLGDRFNGIIKSSRERLEGVLDPSDEEGIVNNLIHVADVADLPLPFIPDEPEEPKKNDSNSVVDRIFDEGLTAHNIYNESSLESILRREEGKGSILSWLDTQGRRVFGIVSYIHKSADGSVACMMSGWKRSADGKYEEFVSETLEGREIQQLLTQPVVVIHDRINPRTAAQKYLVGV